MNSGVVGSFLPPLRGKHRTGVFFPPSPGILLDIMTSVPRVGLGVAVGSAHRTSDIIPTCPLTVRSKA